MPISYNDKNVKKPHAKLEYTKDRIKIIENCMYDFFEFCPFIKIVHSDFGKIKFEPRWYQEEIIKKVIDNRHSIFLASRQVGKTTIIASFILWYCMFNSNKTVGVVSNKENSAKDILKRIKNMYEELPYWLKPGVKIYNKTNIIFDNDTEIMVSATSPDAFRGRTLNFLLCDEFSFVNSSMAEEFWASNYPTLAASSTSKIVIISTPNGIGNLFHTLYINAEKGYNSFVWAKYDYTVIPGRDKEWVEKEKRNMGETKFLQEHCVKFLGSALTVIHYKVLEKLLSSHKDPIQLDLNDSLRIYEHPIDKQKYVLGCLPINEKVLTNNGIQNVQDIKITDKLYDKNGNLTRIKNIQKYKDVREKIYNINVYGSFRTTGFTKEHPLYVSHNPPLKRIHGGERYRDFNFQYIEAKNVKKEDWVKFPNIYKDKTLNFDINDKWIIYNNVIRKDFVEKSPLEDEDFWWFVGIWLGDGWIQKRNHHFSVHTCHNIKTEKHYAIKVKKLFKKYNRSVIFIEKKSVIETVFSSKQLHNFLYDNFGKYADKKYISEWVKYIPNRFKYQLIKGYIDSDGCLTNGETFNIVSVSLKLLEDIQDITYSIGILSNLCLLRKKTKKKFNGGNKISNCKQIYSLNFSTFDSFHLSKLIKYPYTHKIKRDRNKRFQYFSKDKDHIFLKIKNIKITEYQGDVYNFETYSHSFLSRNIITHNCDIGKGTGEHDSTIQISKIISIDPFKLEQVCVYQDNKTDVYTFADIIYKLCLYYNNAHLMVENNAEGSVIVNKIWWDYEYENLVNESTKRTGLGIRATKMTKPKAVITMKKLIENNDLILHDKQTIDQLTTFIESSPNIFKGKDKKPDDLISALYWMCYITEFDLFDEEMSIDTKQDDEGWGILSDIDLEVFDWMNE